jgi:hypothetical protein
VVQFDNPPPFDFWNNKRRFLRKEIIEFYADKEYLEATLAANKYNL